MRDDLPTNAFKQRLSSGKPLIGLWLTLASPTATEIAAGAGFDWLLIDMEHAPNELPDVLHHLRAAEGGTAEPVVRVPWSEPVAVKRLLDIGARSLLFPFIQSADEARRAVRSTRYPPDGIRGVAGVSRATRYGRVAGYYDRAPSEICVIVQIETRKAVDAIEEIAAVPGVDALFVGPSDLSADLGFKGNWSSPEAWAKILEAGARIQKTGKPAGFLSGREEDCRKVLEAGFGFVAVGSDVGVFARSLDGLAKAYKG
jgi:4-hydroxy-2-oxoheptanedioate aldolase